MPTSSTIAFGCVLLSPSPTALSTRFSDHVTQAHRICSSAAITCYLACRLTCSPGAGRLKMAPQRTCNWTLSSTPFKSPARSGAPRASEPAARASNCQMDSESAILVRWKACGGFCVSSSHTVATFRPNDRFDVACFFWAVLCGRGLGLQPTWALNIGLKRACSVRDNAYQCTN